MTENRILFALDSPWSDQNAAVRLIKNLPLPEEEQALILGKMRRNCSHFKLFPALHTESASLF